MPALSRVVFASANVIPVNGSTVGPYTLSGSHSESIPAASSSPTAASNSPGTPAAPSETPILTRMLATLPVAGHPPE